MVEEAGLQSPKLPSFDDGYDVYERKRALSSSSGIRKPSFITEVLQSPTNDSHEDEYNIYNWIMSLPVVTRINKWITRHSKPHHVLCGIPKKNKWRKRVKSIVNSIWFFIFIAFIVVTHFIVLALYIPYINQDFEFRNLILAYVNIVFVLIYIIEAGLRIFSAGFILHRSSYMRSWDNILDIIVIIIGLFSSNHYVIVFEIFAALMALRLLRILAYFDSVQFILKALGRSLLPLLHLGWFIFCVMMFFALIGIELDTTGNLHNGCFVNYTDKFDSTEIYRVSDYPCSLFGSHKCNQVENRSYCGYWAEGPNSGLVGFDNLATAMLTVFQCMTLEGWTSVLYLYDSSVIYGVAWIYFLGLIIFGSILILNLFLGVLTSVFIGVSERQEELGNTRALKEKRKLEEELHGYRDWIKTALEEETGVTNTSGSGQTPAVNVTRKISSQHSVDSEVEFELEIDNALALSKNGRRLFTVLHHARFKIWRVVKSHVFFWFMIIIIFLNLIILSCDHYNSQPILNNVISYVNYVFTTVYIIEMCLKLFAFGVNQYFISNFNKLNFFLTSINILDLLVLVHIRPIGISISQIVNAIRALRLITILKYTRYWHGMKAIVNAFANIWSTMLSLLGLLGVYLVLVALLGMRLFRTRLAIPDLGHPNFNNFIDAMLLAFQLATTEDWHVVMYSTANSYQYSPSQFDWRWIIAIYYLSSIIIGGLLLANIFLAIAVDKLLEVNEVEKDITKRVEKMEEQRREREKQLSALKNPSSEPSGLGRTLKKIVLLYSFNVSREEEIKRRKINKKKRPRSELIRRVSTQSEITLQERRKSFNDNRATSDPIRYNGGDDDDDTIDPTTIANTNTNRGRLFPHKVILKNPLRKVEESIELQSYHTEPRRGYLDKMDSMTSITDEYDDFDWFKKRPSASIRTVPDPERNKGPDVHQLVRTLSMPVSDASSSQYSISRNTSIESGMNTSSMVSSDSFMSQGSSLLFGNSPLPESNQLPDNIDSLLRGNYPSRYSPGTTSKVLPSSRTVPGPLVPGNNPIMKPGATPMIVSSNNVDDDDSMTRLARQSSLEEITPVVLSEEVTEHQQERMTDSKLKHYKESLKMKMNKVKDWAKSYFGSIELDPRNELESIPKHSTFFVIAPDNRLRLWSYNIVKSKAFQTIAYTVTILSTLVLAVESPVPVQPGLYCILQETVLYFDIAILVWFFIEMFLKVIVLGFIVHRGSYLRGLFNIIDFLIIVVTIIPMVVYLMNSDRDVNVQCYSYSQQIPRVYIAVLVLRVSRPIRAIRIGGLFLVTRGVFASLKRMGHILFIGLLCLLIFAVIGVQCFKGRFFFCSDDITEYEEECKGSYFVFPIEDLNCPTVVERSWNEWRLNFNNIFWSILTLFTMLTKEGWQEAMYRAIDSTGQARGPKYNSTRVSLIYFILYMLFVTFFMLNFIVGFIIVTFQKVGIKTYKDSNLDRNQRNCLYVALTAHYKKGYVPKKAFHRFCNSIITSTLFERTIFIAIFINTAILAVQHYQMSLTLTKFIYWINVGFTVLFTLEAILKLIILTPSNYFRNFSRVFEFLVVVGSLAELILQNTVESFEITGFMYSHVISTFRVLRLTLVSKNTRLVFWTLLRSLEIFPWIGVLLVLVLYMFAVSGMQLFGSIEVTSIDNLPNTAIHQYNNFENFFQAIKVMIRTFTGENWERIMLSCVNADCSDSLNGTMANNTMSSICGSPAAYVFFPSFFFLSSILVLNLFVSIIIDNFDYYIRDKSILGSHHLRDFPSLWAKFDHNRSGALKHNRVIDMMKSVEPPLGWGKLCPQMAAYKRMMRLNIPLMEDDTVTFNATLLAIVRQSLKINTTGNINEENIDLKNKLRSVFPSVPKKMLDTVIPERTDLTTGKLYGTLVIQYHWRSTKLSQRKLELYKLQKRMSSITSNYMHAPLLGRELLKRKGTLAAIQNIPSLTEEPIDTHPRQSRRPLNLSIANDDTNVTPIDHDTTPTNETTPTNNATPTIPMHIIRRQSQMIRLATIEETNDIDESSPSSSDMATPTVMTTPTTIDRIQKRQSSTISESDLFATPTGSLSSLNSLTETTV